MLSKIHRCIGVLVVLILVFSFLIVGYVHLFSRHFIVSREDLTDISLDAALVLGATVYSDGTLSHAVQQRADLAFMLRKDAKVRKILISGDNRTRYYDEVTTIKNYLLKKGVPETDMLLDEVGLDTYDSMYRAGSVFGLHTLLIPTQQFHLPRAVYLARKLGLEARGVSVDPTVVHFVSRSEFREFFALQKAWGEVMFGSQPRYLGKSSSTTEINK